MTKLFNAKTEIMASLRTLESTKTTTDKREFVQEVCLSVLAHFAKHRDYAMVVRLTKAMKTKQEKACIGMWFEANAGIALVPVDLATDKHGLAKKFTVGSQTFKDWKPTSDFRYIQVGEAVSDVETAKAAEPWFELLKAEDEQKRAEAKARKAAKEREAAKPKDMSTLTLDDILSQQMALDEEIRRREAGAQKPAKKPVKQLAKAA